MVVSIGLPPAAETSMLVDVPATGIFRFPVTVLFNSTVNDDNFAAANPGGGPETDQDLAPVKRVVMTKPLICSKVPAPSCETEEVRLSDALRTDR